MNPNEATTTQNPLYPIFLKLYQLRMLIVGAGEVGLEKLSFILKSSPNAQITIVAPEVRPEIEELMAKHPQVQVVRRKYLSDDLRNKDLVIAATNFRDLNEQVRNDAKSKGILVNVADTPELCDFYLGAIVTRGNLKVAISTNGKSPTFAKRFRQVLEEILPHNTPELLDNLHEIRNQLVGGFSAKVQALNELTASLISPASEANN